MLLWVLCFPPVRVLLPYVHSRYGKPFLRVTHLKKSVSRSWVLFVSLSCVLCYGRLTPHCPVACDLTRLSSECAAQSVPPPLHTPLKDSLICPPGLASWCQDYSDVLESSESRCFSQMGKMAVNTHPFLPIPPNSGRWYLAVRQTPVLCKPCRECVCSLEHMGRWAHWVACCFYHVPWVLEPGRGSLRFCGIAQALARGWFGFAWRSHLGCCCSRLWYLTGEHTEATI